jgi:hypothetical protein
MAENHKAASCFKRYEQKYLLQQDQYHNFLNLMGDAFQSDKYGPSTIYTVYYDTPDHRIIGKAFTKAVFREKLRLRSYGIPGPGINVYVEIKKKYNGIIYKRRFPVDFENLKDLYTLPSPPSAEEGLFDEFRFFYQRYSLAPVFFLSYNRVALESKSDKRLRLTFDTNIRWRSDNFDFTHGNSGYPLLKADECLMELKTVEPIPLYVSNCLTKNKIFPASFSKSKLAYLGFTNGYEDSAS